MRRKHQTVVVGVRHDEGTHKTCGDTPGVSPYIFRFVVLINESYVEGLCKILAKVVGCTRLKRLAVLHHGFDCVCVECTGKALVGTLHTLDNRHSHIFLGEFGVEVNHLHGTCLRLFSCSMSAMALLPEEFGGAEEHAGTHFPAHHVGPLIAEHGKVAVGMNPVLVGTPDYGLGCRADYKFLLEASLRVDDYTCAIRIVLETVVGNNCALLGKALHMLRLAAEIRFGNKQREVGVLYTCLLEHFVEGVLHLLPYGVAIGFDDHAAAHSRLLGQIGLHNEVVIPLGVVFTTFRKVFKFLCHCKMELKSRIMYI